MSEETLFDSARRLTEEGEPFAIVTITKTIGSTPRQVGTSMIVKEDGKIIGTIGGGAIEASVIEQATQALKERKPRTYELPSLQTLDQRCGGGMTFFINVSNPRPTLVIFGAGHVAVPTARLAKTAGFRVVVIDPRKEYSNRERFPEADQLINEDFAEAAGKIHIDDQTYVIVMSPDHLKDELTVEKVITSEAAYVGMIGSEAKALLTLHSLKKRVPEEILRRVKTPMGLEIGAETPGEIAISIVAELIRTRRGGTGEPMSVAQKERF